MRVGRCQLNRVRQRNIELLVVIQQCELSPLAIADVADIALDHFDARNIVCVADELDFNLHAGACLEWQILVSGIAGLLQYRKHSR